jgi:predicted acylesterase/phospholipase RssA
MFKYANNILLEAVVSMLTTQAIARLTNEEDNFVRRQKRKRRIIPSPLPALPTTLVIGGGGMKAFYLLGGLSRLYEEGLLKRVTRFAGTSAGALLCTLLAMKYDAREIMWRALTVPSLSKFTPRSVMDLMTVVLNNGSETFDDIIQMLGVMFQERGLGRDATFADVYRHTRNELLIVTTRLTRFSVEEVVFSTQNTPDMSVALAVRMSCSVPILTKPVPFDDSMYVDGCIVNNFPVNRSIVQWPDGEPILAVGIDRNNKLVHCDSVSYVMIPVSKKYGEGILSSTSNRFCMYLHGRRHLGRRKRRATV